MLTAFFLFLNFVSLSANQPPQAAEADDRQKIQGHWKLTDIESDEKEQPGDFISKQDLIKSLHISFEGKEFITSLGDSIQREPYKIDPTQKPKAIDVTRVMNPPVAQFLRPGEQPKPPPPPKFEVVTGIYELEGDKLKLSLPVNAKMPRPKSFKAARESGLPILILERDTSKRAESRIRDSEYLAEIRKVGVSAFLAGHPGTPQEQIYVEIKGEQADQILEKIAPQLRKLSYITGLHLYDSGITDKGLAHLKDMNNIGHINLRNTKITDAGLQHLTGIKKLHTVILSGTKVSEEGIKRAKKMLPLTEFEKLSEAQQEAELAINKAGGILYTASGLLFEVRFERNTAFSDNELTELQKHLEVWKDSLTRLDFSGTSITDNGLKRLHALKKLKQLKLTNTKVTELGVKELKQHLPGLEVDR